MRSDAMQVQLKTLSSRGLILSRPLQATDTFCLGKRLNKVLRSLTIDALHQTEKFPVCLSNLQFATRG